MFTPAAVRMFAGYNAWANRRVYDAAAKLGDADFRADRGAFFKSVCGTLNRLLATDRIWMHRFTGEGPAGYRARLQSWICFSATGKRTAGAAAASCRGLPARRRHILSSRAQSCSARTKALA